MNVYLFSVPVNFDSEVHPLGATPADLIEVTAKDEVQARILMNQTLGNRYWASCYLPGDAEVERFTGERIGLER